MGEGRKETWGGRGVGEGGEGNERKLCDHSKIWLNIGATNIIKNHTTITIKTLHRHAYSHTNTLHAQSTGHYD